RLDDDDGQIAGGEDRLRFIGKLDRTGTVDERKAFAHEFGCGDGRLDAHQMRACLGRRIADGVAGSDGILPGYRTGSCEQCFKKGGFSARKGTDDGYAFRSLASFSGSDAHDDLTSISRVSS